MKIEYTCKITIRSLKTYNCSIFILNGSNVKCFTFKIGTNVTNDTKKKKTVSEKLANDSAIQIADDKASI